MNTPQPEATLIRKKELARRLSVSPRTIDEWARKRMIPYLPVTRRLYLYEFEDVLAALKKHYEIETVTRT